MVLNRFGVIPSPKRKTAHGEVIESCVLVFVVNVSSLAAKFKGDSS
jgi:hypothetical protein